MAVHLGIVQDIEHFLLESRFFPSKIGGRPAWLDLKNLPPASDISCPLCNIPRKFLCQLYCPIDDKTSTFHRTIFIFVCFNKLCFAPNFSQNFLVLRCQLAKKNDFYSSDPPVEEISWMPNVKCENYGINLCYVCGIMADIQCCKCKQNYCCEYHCCACNKSTRTDDIAIKEFGLSIESETESSLDSSDSDSCDGDDKIQNFQQISETIGLFQDDSTVETYVDETAIAAINDIVFQKFKQHIRSCPEQVIRYSRDGEPLWLSDKNTVTSDQVPCCQYCGAQRQFEFQVMPQMLNYLKLDTTEKDSPAGVLDWATLAIFTCKKSCDSGSPYKIEFIHKQDVLH